MLRPAIGTPLFEMSFILRLTPPKEPPVEYSLDLDRIRLGRSESNDIVVKTPQVSSLHLELKREGEAFRLIDQDSTNGTKVNGREVDEVVLKDGDEILIGNHVAGLFSIRRETSSPEAEGDEETTPVAVVAAPEASSEAPPVRPKPAPAIPVASPKKPVPSIPAATPKKPVAVPAAGAPRPVSAAPAAKPAPAPGQAAPTVVVKRSAGASVPPARPPIKIAKPMPPAARKGGEES